MNTDFIHRAALWRLAISPAVMLAVVGCTTTRTTLARGADAYAVVATHSAASDVDYVLGPSDVVSVAVANEPSLALKDVQITTGGYLSMPLIGQVQVAGLTTGGLADEIATRLGARFLINPDVTVNLTTAASQKVTVEGSVSKPGIYRLEGRTTLLGAIAMAEGTTRVSATKQVVVLRSVDGQQVGAVFDLDMIRRGKLLDPEIRGSDTVVVGFSFLKGAWRDILTAAPLVAVFRAYR